ncbi:MULTISPECIES: hypothetical protein [Pseudoalteromonas]|uniref:hypothetical protein n=1 Tax=Pseudoalteromonas TaxID=53246 RepID=UPI001CB72691|nr:MULTISPECIES: hypothetical protein [Pseudoalteromonas]
MIGIYTRQSQRSIVTLCKSGDNTVEMLIKRCPLGSSECALFIVAQLLPRLLGGKSSVATKTHSEEQKSNSKGQQALDKGSPDKCFLPDFGGLKGQY